MPTPLFKNFSLERLSEVFGYIKAELDKKVTVVNGKGLSTNDYTTTEKNKLSGIASGAEVNVQSNWSETNSSSDAYILNKPTKLSQFTDDVVSGHYLPLTGGTLTNTLVVGNNTNDTPIYVNGNSSGAYIGFRNAAGNETYGYYGVKSDKLPYFYSSGSKRIALLSEIPTKTSQLTNDSGFLTSHQDISGKVNKSGDTMTGTLNIDPNIVQIDFRNQVDYHTTVSHQTSGNEALVFATKQSVTSFIFVNGEDSITNHGSSRWQSLTPALQIKNNSVYIGSLIANGTTPSYKFSVTGSSFFNGSINSSYRSNTWVNSLTNSVVTLSDDSSTFGGWICGPTKNGRIVISTYSSSDDLLYFGYGERGRTTNSYVKTMTWDGPTGTLTTAKFVGALTGNVTGNCSGSSGFCTGNSATATLLFYTHTNEINFRGGAQSTCYFNYRNADTDASATSAAITYKFCNYTSSTLSTTIEAATFKGNLTGSIIPTNDNTVNIGSSNKKCSDVYTYKATISSLYLYNTGQSKTATITFDGATNRSISVPDKAGTIALTSDIVISGTTFYSGNSGTAEHNANSALKNGHYYYTLNGPSEASTTDGALYVQSYSDTWVGQIAQDYRQGNLFVRGKNNGTWSAWRKVACLYTYTGTVSGDALIVTHNLGLGTSYKPMVTIVNGSGHCLIVYAIANIATNGFVVDIMNMDNYVPKGASGYSVTIVWTYI